MSVEDMGVWQANREASLRSLGPSLDTLRADYAALGRFAEAERLYKEVLAYEEEKRQHGQRDTTDFATTLKGADVDFGG